MRVLLVKLSSLGDVVHSYPAVTDAAAAVPGIEIDWLVDEAFAPLARLHPSVRRVIALPIRRMKKQPRATFSDLRQRLAELRAERYDVLIDAQGLLKSAFAGRLARATTRHGFGRGSAREGMATLFYDRRHDIPETEHMAVRIRRLFAASLGYAIPASPPDAGLRYDGGLPGDGRPYVVLIHGTSWKTKTWTREGWRDLAARLDAQGLDAVLFAHGAVENERVAAIAAGLGNVHILPPASIESLVPVLAGAAGVVTVDTGLGHLAAALALPTIGLYGPTNPGLTGLVGPNIAEIVSNRTCAPCEKANCAIRPDFGEGPPCLADQTAEAVVARLLRQIAISTPEL
ncbi:lipopolysaccharide heptosyltransferase I [Kaistia algarum]|uniref:lipopolysaccharide heptosyltransferase I n=1 Tax=Kaistia algarum TaxID=2083279 RepID=UPI000CE77438|nr:lipopolysaccharide heptosyltransferase I [Kaistia algarum]MCX5514932.1 lipopolysaccharide heptosyltransferase I [Kaistia algarum]PPE79680.1 lipopolysaccharide heptosyltransferase I [Kaistia algarum]